MFKFSKEFKDWYCSKGNQLHLIATLLIWVSLFIIHIYLAKVVHAPFNVMHKFEGIMTGISIALPLFGFFRMGIVAGIDWMLIGGFYCYAEYDNGRAIIASAVSMCLTITLILYNLKAAKIMVLAFVYWLVCTIIFCLFLPYHPSGASDKLTYTDNVTNSSQH